MSTLVRSFDFFDLFKKFIRHSKSGRRLQPNGKRISHGTLRNYEFAQMLLRRFSEEKNFALHIRSVRRLSQRELAVDKRYWKNLYKEFTNYLYNDLGFFDNYVGMNIKIIKTFLGFLNKDLGLAVGEFHKSFYVPKEEISIFPLMPEELNFLIYNKEFEASLKARIKEVKDFFVFGCTVALRFSDLVALTKSHIRTVGDTCYLAVRSIKTNTETLIKLPDYAADIIRKYSKLKKRLLPRFNNANLNKFIKRLLEQAGFTQPVCFTRNKRGVAIPTTKNSPVTRFCDVATTHTMRRTAITTMLSLGVPEQLVRKISGHSTASKEFYRYVFWAQTYQDQEMEKMFAALGRKKLAIL